MGFDEFGRHEDGVVEGGEGAVPVKGAGVKDGLGLSLYGLLLGVGGGFGPGVVVVDSW